MVFAHVAEDPVVVCGDCEVRATSFLAGLVDLIGVSQWKQRPSEGFYLRLPTIYFDAFIPS